MSCWRGPSKILDLPATGISTIPFLSFELLACSIKTLGFAGNRHSPIFLVCRELLAWAINNLGFTLKSHFHNSVPVFWVVGLGHQHTWVCWQYAFLESPCLLSCSQKSSFTEQLEALLKGKPLGHKDKLLPLGPFLDDDGLIRATGRLTEAPLPWATKHRII